MSDTIIGALIGVGSAIIGAIIAGPITYYYSQKLIRQTHENALKVSREAVESSHENALKVIKRQEFNKGASAFHTAFVDVIFTLRQNIKTGEIPIRKVMTDDLFISHEKAKILLEPFLLDSELIGFNKAWEEYKNCEENYYQKLDKNPIHQFHK